MSSFGKAPHLPTRAFSLVELLVALSIGLFLLAGAVPAYIRGRATFETNETVDRLQDAGRYALSVIEPDIAMAGYFGFTNTGVAFQFVAGGRAHTLLATADRLRQRSNPRPEIGLSAQACGRNFAIDLLSAAQGSNNIFALGPDRASSCAPYAPGAQSGTDTLTLRRAALDTRTAEAGRIQILTSRLGSFGGQYLFVDGQAPVGPDIDHEVHDLDARAYYVAESSVDHAHFPALRVKSLTSVSGQPGFTDTEIMPGIEDLQVQFAIAPDPDDGRTSRYVDPDFPGLDQQRILAIRLWVRVRAENPEAGFVDDRRYDYADVSFTPAGANRSIRRVLLTRTIALRNARSS